MPVVFMTAVYAFEHLTRLRNGQKVLIQSAWGGLGLAAIQLARASRLATEACIFGAIAATNSGGFDVILSTAHGDMLYHTIKALAPLGHLIDIGRLDVNEAHAVGLELFQKSASFSSFDLARVVDHDCS